MERCKRLRVERLAKLRKCRFEMGNKGSMNFPDSVGNNHVRLEMEESVQKINAGTKIVNGEAKSHNLANPRRFVIYDHRPIIVAVDVKVFFPLRDRGHNTAPDKSIKGNSAFV